jgi:hypothetical protein
MSDKVLELLSILKTKNRNEAQDILRAYQKKAMQGRLAELNQSETLSVFVPKCLRNNKLTRTPATHESMKYTLEAFREGYRK